MGNLTYYPLLSFALLLLLSACDRTADEVPVPDFHPHLLPIGDYFTIEPKVVDLDSMAEPAYVEIESSIVSNIQPDYVSFNQGYQEIEEPAYFASSGTPVFGDSAVATRTAGQAVATGGAWPKWSPYQPAFKENTRLQLDFLGEKNGLKSMMTAVRSITEDSRGNMWLGTIYQVYIYDGTGYYRIGQQEGLGKCSVEALLEDRDGDMWIGLDGRRFRMAGARGGIHIWDGQELAVFTTEQGLSTDFTTALLEDQAGNIWIGSPIGLNVWDGEAFTHYTVEEGFQFPAVTSLAEDKAGNIWIGTEEGLYQWNGTGFLHFDDVQGLANTMINDLLTDSSGQLWAATFDGVYAWNGQGFTQFTTPWISNFTYSLGEAEDGSIWFGEEGFSVWDGKGLSHYDKEDGLPSQYAYRLHRDVNGNMWVVHFYGHGISIHKPDGFEDMTPDFFRDRQKGDSFLSLGSSGKMLLGNFNNGLHIWDGKGYSHYYDKSQERYEAYRILEDGAGRIWWAGNGGLYRLEDGVIRRFDLPDIKRLIEDMSGNIWIGADDALYLYDGIGFKEYDEAQGFIGDTNSALMHDAEGALWIGSWYTGLFRMDDETVRCYEIKSGSAFTHVIHLLEDERGNIWIGTLDDGLYRWDGTGFARFTQNEGLSDNRIAAIEQDSLGYIWVATYAGLNRLEYLENEEAMGLERFGLKDGLPELSLTDLEIDDDNQLWVANTSGVSKVDLAALWPDNSPPKLNLQEVRLFFDETDWRTALDSIQADGAIPTVGEQNYSLAKVDYDEVIPHSNMPKDPVFPYNMNQLTFRWAGVHWAAPHQLQYTYILEGQDDYWSPLTSDYELAYQDLRPGSYSFKVKALAVNGSWSETASYAFRILPPWWESWWAKVVYLLLVLAGFLLFYRFQLRRKLEQEEARRLVELDSLKTRLYTNITHEFRTPLTVIQGMADHMQGDEQAKKLIRRNSKNLLQLINQLLDMSKLESGKLNLELIQGDVIPYLHYLLEAFQSYAASRNIELSFSTELEQLVMDYDPEKIQHIMANLISNAIKFTQEDGFVQVRVAQVLEKDGKLDLPLIRIEVEDNGIGIQAKHIPHVFDRFYQVDDTNTRRGEGTGIGLALTKELVTLMNGSVHVASQMGQGTTFTVLLPITTEAAQSTAPHETALVDFTPLVPAVEQVEGQENSEAATLAQERPILLVIEDNPDVVAYIKMCLEGPYEVHAAYDGQSGIDKALELIPDIIISDVMMPRKDGFEVTEFLKNNERTSHIPIIMLTAKADADSRLEGLKRGADAYLAKPFDKTELMIRMAKLVELRKRLQERYGQARTPVPSDDVGLQIEDAFLQKVREAVYEQLDNAAFGVSELCETLHISQSHLYRKIKALTGKSIASHMRSIRLYRGYELLQSTDLTISEVAYDVGFTDPNYFSKTFHKEFGFPPSEAPKP